MKKLLIAMLLSITTTYAFQPTSEQIEQYYKDVLKHEELFKNPDVLKFILCHKTLDGHLYGVNIVQQAQDVSKKIHERFIVEFYIAQDIVKYVNKGEDPIKIIATSLDKTLDTPIIHECALIAERVRSDKRAGTVKTTNSLTGRSAEGDGAVFYENGCSCFLYNTFTDQELAELIKQTQS